MNVINKYVKTGCCNPYSKIAQGVQGLALKLIENQVKSVFNRKKVAQKCTFKNVHSSFFFPKTPHNTTKIKIFYVKSNHESEASTYQTLHT